MKTIMKTEAVKDVLYLFFPVTGHNKEHIGSIIAEGVYECRYAGVKKVIFIGNGKNLFFRHALLDSMRQIDRRSMTQFVPHNMKSIDRLFGLWPPVHHA